jgi:hypothetical protein
MLLKTLLEVGERFLGFLARKKKKRVSECGKRVKD